MGAWPRGPITVLSASQRRAATSQLRKTNRHRLNRGGDRQANAALHRIVISRLRWDARTRAYAERRTKEGMSKKEIIRCLKRYVAREVYTLLTPVNPTPMPA